MASNGDAKWTVIILAEDSQMEKNYKMTPNTRLAQIMERWMYDNEVIGYWVFMSPKRDTVYDESISLETIGEIVVDTKIVTLRVELSNEPQPTTNIFVHHRCKCHHLQVSPNMKLHEALCQHPGKSVSFAHNDLPLNLRQTVKQSGLRNNALISESRQQMSINVKLSNDRTRIFELPEDSLVLHLSEKVKLYEATDFSLVHKGRYLHPEECIKEFKQVIEVTTSEFTVQINQQSFSWITRSEAIGFPEFIAQLSMESEMDAQQLEEMEFYCIGCHRRIRKSEEDVQRLPMDCCKERSLTLNAKTPLNEKSHWDTAEIQHFYAQIQNFYEHIVQCRSADSRAKASRYEYTKIMETFLNDGLNYWTINKMREKLNVQLDNNLKILDKEFLKLKDENLKYIEEIRRQKGQNLRHTEEIRTLTGTATASSALSLPKTPVRSQGVKLLILYDHRYFSAVVSRPEFTHQGSYPWSSQTYYFKCVIPGLHPGWSSYEEVRDILRLFVVGEQIRRIDQCRGFAAGRDVAEATSRADDEHERYLNDMEFCDDGELQVSWNEAGRPWHDQIREGGRILMCGDQRRTVLEIHQF